MKREDRQDYNWSFFGFETPAGNRPVRDWIRNDIPEEAHDELVDIVLYMRIRPNSEWAKEHFKPLEDGISEIRFQSADSIWRIYGYFGPADYFQSYTFLVGAEKKIKNDRDSKRLAKIRRHQIGRKEARVHLFSFEG